MTQTWYNVLFAHWPVPAAALQALLPRGVTVDTHQGQAWLGVVPFGMQAVRLRGLPPVPGTTRFLELNVRTYVRGPAAGQGERPGVWFFSLDAANPLAVAVARRWYHLPYYSAQMEMRRQNGGTAYHSYRTHPGAAPAEFQARYRPVGKASYAPSGSLEAWLTERYCLYTADRRGRLLCGDIHHAPWHLQRAEAEIGVNTMTLGLGLTIPPAPVPPLLHYAKEIETVEWPLRPAAPAK